MEKAIYLIENKINHKKYVGQSKNPTQRFLEHTYKSSKKDNSLINKAIQKYGKENFSFTILGWFEDYNEKEKYYISYFQSLAPNGYNIQKGGEEPPYHSRENHPRTFLTEEQVKSIQKDLQNYSLSLEQIRKKYRISKDILRHIKDGSSWHDENLHYPLRPTQKELNTIKVNKVKELLKTTNLSQADIGKQVGWNRSAITMINIGKNYFDKNEQYPIRKPQRNWSQKYKK